MTILKLGFMPSEAACAVRAAWGDVNIADQQYLRELGEILLLTAIRQHGS